MSPPPIPQASFNPPSTQINPPAPAKNQLGPIKGYGKIDPLLNDSSVLVVECQGPEKPLIIMRMGQRQFTKIILNSKDIMEILNHISEETHIPLMEGVFRATVGSFSISAIISQVIGAKFVIKKQTPYSLFND